MEPDQVAAEARFEQLFAAHYGDLMRYATRRVGADAASDVVSSTFMIAWRRLADVPADQNRAWLYGTARKVSGRGSHRRLVMAGVVATTAAAAVSMGVVTTPWSHGRPAAAAYAVTEQGDGAVSVTVHWNELRDPAELNAELARLGARTVVMLRSADGQCRTGFATDPAHSGVMHIDLDEHPELRDPAKLLDYLRAQSPWIDHVDGLEAGAVFTIHPDRIPADDTLLIPYEFAPSHPAQPGRAALGFTSILVREVPACVPSNADSVYTPSGVEVR